LAKALHLPRARSGIVRASSGHLPGFTVKSIIPVKAGTLGTPHLYDRRSSASCLCFSGLFLMPQPSCLSPHAFVSLAFSSTLSPHASALMPFFSGLFFSTNLLMAIPPLPPAAGKTVFAQPVAMAERQPVTAFRTARRSIDLVDKRLVDDTGPRRAAPANIRNILAELLKLGAAG
jgi:hypothetical protein